MFLMKLFSKLFQAAVFIRPEVGSSGRFDPRNMPTSGVYDAQTGFGYDKQLWSEMRTRTFIGALSRSSDKIDTMMAGSPQSLDGSAMIIRKPIDSGDLLRMTMREHSTGIPSYGDLQHPAGDAPAYKNLDVRVNMVNLPAIPVVGEMAQQRIKASISDLPGDIKEEVLDGGAETMEIEALYSLIYSASPSVLFPSTSGGLGYSPGINAGAGAGTPLMNRWWYTNDSGFVTYSNTPATYNAAVDTAIAAIDPTIADSISLASLKKIRAKMDTIKWRNIKFAGRQYKAICLIDTEAWYRLKSLLDANYVYAMPRGSENPLYNVDYVIVLDGIMYIPVPNLNVLRPTSNTTYPIFGPSMTSDWRTYTNSSTNALAIFCGRGAIMEGYSGSLSIHRDTGRFDKGLQIAGRMKLGYVRGEWYAKDNRTTGELVTNNSVICAAFYEEGVGITPTA